MNRSTAALLVVLTCSGCGGGSRLPSAPSAPSGPSSGPPYGPTGLLTISGLVLSDNGGGKQAVPSATVEARVDLGTYEYFFGTFAADAAGRYTIPRLPRATVSLYAHRDGYQQPCTHIVDLTSDTALDVELVSAEHPIPATLSPFTVSGAIFEMTPDGKRPIAGASMGIEQWFDKVIAGTWSDAAGRYVFCGLAPGQFISVFATREGYRQAATQFFTTNGNAAVDIELTR